MESEEIKLLFVALPAVLGLALVAYVGSRVASSPRGFLRVLRGWIVLAMYAALTLYWAIAILDWAGAFDVTDWERFGNLGFVVFASWLAVCMSALGTKYKNLNHTDEFKAWLRKHPLNTASFWGIVGLLVLALTGLIELWEEGVNRTPLSAVPAAAYLVASIVAVFLLYSRWGAKEEAAPSGRASAPRMILLACSWIGIPTTVLVLGVVGELELDFGGYNPCSWILVALLAVLAKSTSVTRFGAMVIDQEAQGVRREGFREYDIPRGAYLIHDEKSDAAFALFSELISLPLRPDAIIPGMEASATATLEYLIPRGLVITREYPEKVRQKHNLKTTPMIWLTESPGERRIAPTSLAVLTDTIVRFMETNPNSLVLLEGLEYICTFNDFKKVLRFLDTLNETAWLTKARLMLTVSPKAFDVKDLALLERDRNVLRGAEGIVNLKVESRTATASTGDARTP